MSSPADKLMELLVGQFGHRRLMEVSKHPQIVRVMYEAAMQEKVLLDLEVKLTPLNDVVEMAREYDGVTGEQIDTMLRSATDNGLIEGFEHESGSSPLLAPVVSYTRESPAATFAYGDALMQQVWDGCYKDNLRWRPKSGDEGRVTLIPGARPFVPDELTLQIVDLGANWNLRDGTSIPRVRTQQAGRLAVFEGLFAATQHPGWMRAADEETVPFIMLAALRFDTGHQQYSPKIGYGGDAAWMCGGPFEDNFTRHALPVRRQYRS